VKVTNGQVVIAKEAMQGLMNRKDIPAKYLVNILRYARKFSEEISVINEARNAIILKYTKEGEKEITQGSEHYEECYKEIALLMAEDSSMDVEPVKIPGTIIKDGVEQDIYFEGQDLLVLDPFIEIV